MDNSGAIFKNDRKQQDNHPDYKGDCEVGGKKFWVSGWIKVAGPNAKNPGSKFMSLAFTEKEVRTAESVHPRSQDSSKLDYDNDIPF